jgi:quercetin dioxygenase-like cupin family protein
MTEQDAMRPFRFAERTPSPVLRLPGVPDAAVELLTADRLYTVMNHDGSAGPWGGGAIPGPAGVSLILAECEPGRGPDLHWHRETDEIFTCLRGRFEVQWGAAGEQHALLDPFDTLRVAPGVSRAFRNVSDEPGLLQVLVTGGVNDANDIGFPRIVEERLNALGPDVVAALRRAGFHFEVADDAGRDA